jgi:hypothetical protein
MCSCPAKLTENVLLKSFCAGALHALALQIVHLSLQGQVQAAFLPSWMERWDDLAVFDVDMSLFSRADGSHSVPLTLESPGTAGLEGPVRMHVSGCGDNQT